MLTVVSAVQSKEGVTPMAVKGAYKTRKIGEVVERWYDSTGLSSQDAELPQWQISLLIMQLAFCFSSMISWLLLALPLPAYYLGGWKGLVEQNGEGGQWKIVVCPPVSGLLGGINVGHGRCQASGLLYSVYTQFEFFVVNGEAGQWRISVAQQSQVWKGGK